MIKQCSNLISQNDLMVFRFDDLLVALFLRINLKNFWAVHLSLSASFSRFHVCVFFHFEYLVEYSAPTQFGLVQQKCVVFISVGNSITLNIRKRTMVYSFEEKFSPQKPVQNKVRNHLHTLFIPILTCSFDSGRSDTHTHMFICVCIRCRWCAEYSIKYSFDILFSFDNFQEGWSSVICILAYTHTKYDMPWLPPPLPPSPSSSWQTVAHISKIYPPYRQMSILNVNKYQMFAQF